MKLKKLGKKVIFDSHEDVPAQILDKGWIPAPLRKLVSASYHVYETSAVKQLDAVVTATPHIAKQFEGRAERVVVVNNYPKLDDIAFHNTSFVERKTIVCYAGRINELRGEKVMLEAMDSVDGTLILAGICDDRLNSNGSSDDGKKQYLGKISRTQVNELYGKSRAGMVIYQPAANHFEAQPIKMFEYMAAGLPFVASNFPLWQRIVDENHCGICVDQTSSEEVAKAVEYLLQHPEEAQQMGRNGREAVMEKYNWDVEGEKLVALYEALCAD